MRVHWVAVGTLALQMALGTATGQQQSASPASSTSESAADSEKQDLISAMQQAAGSRVDYVRALEEHLKKYPDSPYKEKIVRALFQASKELRDQQRVAPYGEQLLEKDADDVSVLAAVGVALNGFDDPKSSERALTLGRRLERDLRSRTTTSAETTEQRLEHAHNLGIALLIQADALGVLKTLPQAIMSAQQSFATYPSAAAARSLGRWEAAASHNDAALRAYADAFALSDSAEHHTDDRQQLTGLYLKGHQTSTGLGDLVLSEYDRMTALQQKLDPQTTSSSDLKSASLLDLQGKKVPLESFSGKVVVMNFWATWCQPCRIQHPLFEQVKRDFKDDARVVFLEVDSGEDRDTVAPFLEKQSWSRDVYLDDGLMQILGIENIPATILLGRDSHVYSEMIGFRPETFAALLTSRIQNALSIDDAAKANSQVN